MVKVCHISTAHPPFDVRIFHKECVSLAEAGFDVSLVVTHSKNETVKNVKIVALPTSNGRFHRMIIKPFIAFKKALGTKSKIYHFHDPELMFIGILLKIFGKKVIFDSHENVSNQIETKDWLGNKSIRKIVKIGYRLIEKFGILFYDKVISVTPEIVAFLTPKKGVLIQNYPIVSLIESKSKTDKTTDKTVLIYAGGLSKIRGIKEICEATEKANANVELQLLGNWESENFKNECLKNKTKINYLGSKPLEEIFPIMKSADVGLLTFYPVKNHLNCMPNKSFEYMICGLPIIMSDFPYWKGLYSSSSLFVNPNSVDEIKQKIEWVVNNKQAAKELGEKGKKEVLEKYSWEAEAKKLTQMYHEIIS